jgi:hypothetical protein
MRVIEYERVLYSGELFNSAIDEGPMTRWMHRSQRQVCFLRGAYALHPAYGGVGGENGGVALEVLSFAAMLAYLQAKYPATYAAVPASEIYKISSGTNWAEMVELIQRNLTGNFTDDAHWGTFLQYEDWTNSTQIAAYAHFWSYSEDRSRALELAQLGR